MCFPSGALPTSRPKPVHEGSRDPAPLGIPGGVLVLANDPPPNARAVLFVGNQTNRARVGLFSAGRRRKCRERPIRDLAAAADQIDNWIRRRVIVSCCGTHPSPSKLNSTRHKRLGLSAIGQCLKAQYDALAAPIPSHLAALLKQLETQERG
jgi:hypothetical protein